MSKLDSKKAEAIILDIVSTIGSIPKSSIPIPITTGKLYELFVLAQLLDHLAALGYTFRFSSPTVTFKTGGGPIKAGDFHIDIFRRAQKVGSIYTDVEVRTLGCGLSSVTDLSQYHETDIVIVSPETIGFPGPDDLLLGIECKATATFQKSHVREVLGRRRELSFYPNIGIPSRITPGKLVNANPPSEYWLAFIDPAGLNYADSPRVFSVELRHLQP